MTVRISHILAAVVLLGASAAAVRAQDGMIGINFLRGNGDTSLGAADVAGFLPQANWNNAGTTADPQIGGLTQVLGPTAGSIVNAAGTAMPGVNVQWASATTWSSGNVGTPDNALMNGYIDNNGTYPTTFVRVTGIPYEHYAIVTYMGSDGNGRTGTVAVAGHGASSYSTNTAPFTGYDAVGFSNVALFEGLSESSALVMNHRGSNNGGLHGLQIVELPGAPPPTSATSAVLGAYYSFDNSANVMADSRGLNNGTLQGAATQGAGRFGAGSLQLDSDFDWGQVAAPTVDIKPTDTLAVSVWVSRTDGNASEVVSLGDHYGLRMNANGTVHFFQDVAVTGSGWAGLTTNVAVPTEVVPADGSWHHIVAQNTTDHLEVWIDGVFAHGAGAVLYETRPIDYAELGTDLFIGRHGNGGTTLDFGGRIDELRIFNGTLTDGEIQSLYANNAVPEPSTWMLAATALLFVAPRLRRRRG
ncbi:MAG: LamG-like jellyroll fold domain-containing protein [Pirellulales bacterium]